MEPTICCPKCKTEIKLTESLAAPLIDATRRELEERLAKKDSEIGARERIPRPDSGPLIRLSNPVHHPFERERQHQ